MCVSAHLFLYQRPSIRMTALVTSTRCRSVAMLCPSTRSVSAHLCVCQRLSICILPPVYSYDMSAPIYSYDARASVTSTRCRSAAMLCPSHVPSSPIYFCVSAHLFVHQRPSICMPYRRPSIRMTRAPRSRPPAAAPPPCSAHGTSRQRPSNDTFKQHPSIRVHLFVYQRPSIGMPALIYS